MSNPTTRSDALFTPGPWEWVDGMLANPELWDTYRKTRASDPEDTMPDGIVMSMEAWVSENGETADYDVELNDANANLIASAPCLFQALNDLLNYAFACGWDDLPDELQTRCVNALAKAKGGQA